MTGLTEHFERVALIRRLLRIDLLYHEYSSTLPVEEVRNYQFSDLDFKTSRSSSDQQIFTANGEQIAFLKYNLHRKKLKEFLNCTDIDFKSLRECLAQYDELRHFIASCYNSLAHFATLKYKGQRTRNATVEDEYEVCCMTLMRAIDLYDPARGFRFTTYVTKSMLTNLFSKVHTNKSNLMKTWYKTTSWHADYGENLGAFEIDWSSYDRKSDLDDIMAYGFRYLTSNQRYVLLHRFGIGVTPKTLEEVSVDIGVTRERVRQIEGKALRILQLTCDKYKGTYI